MQIQAQILIQISHQIADNITRIITGSLQSMCLFCLKLAIRSAHTSGTRVRQCWAAAGQEGLRGLALAVLPLAKDLGKLRRATVTVLLSLRALPPAL